METIINNWPLIMNGLAVTLQVSALVLLIGTVIGVFGGLSLLYGVWPLRWLVRAYVDIIRGIPLLVLIFAIRYGAPVLGVRMPVIAAAVVALSIFCGAHVSEVVRGGIESIPKGQTDAAKAIGLTLARRLRYVVFPQAIGRVLPPWVNTAVELVKASSLVALVSEIDLLLATYQIAARTRQTLLMYGVAALIYFLINFSISQVGLLLERRFKYAK
jgi:polar amino acid transport system permease protein